MKLGFTTLTALAALLQSATAAISLDTQDVDSIKKASGELAYGLMSFYKNNQSSTPIADVGTLPDPLYWWEAGAVWGAMVDYTAYTEDTSYVATVQQALLAQVGPHSNFMPPAYFFSLGNDDQAFWVLAAISALEYDFPFPAGNASTTWLSLAEAGFNTMVPRWNMSSCNGGLSWQIFPDNVNGMSYKNSISNGGMFQVAARLAHYTGNQTYLDWCDKIWDWMEGVNLISANYDVWDGTSYDNNCSDVNHQPWSYNPSMMLYGSAVLYNHTSSSVWQDRTTGLLKACANTFFSPFPNATDIAFERVCETKDTCNNDQYSFKAYLSRWLAKSAVVAPFIRDSVFQLLNSSATAGVQTCTGGESGELCGHKWYVGGFDGSSGVGQQLAVLETVQALLLLQDDVQPVTPVKGTTAQSGGKGRGKAEGGSVQTSAAVQAPAAPSTTPAASGLVTVLKTKTVLTTAES
ncbi:hypothetical protein LTR09_011825 [Extremus antarcticus]|uniref:Mannan endo-1,6-alpha-mannosidase n=1 Tax=Extremus antarcticus TaxID=702011 RepID=A0AAJ0D5N1_9PEZI|nr:hypothetical protein LTR09_011825 [Extremus antarcticus]